MGKLSKTIILIVCLMAMLLAMPAWAGQYLVCDPQVGVTKYEVEVDGALQPEFVAETDGSMKWPVSGMVAGQHVFRARCSNADNWWSDWSGPYSPTKPAGPASIRITVIVEVN